MHFIHLYSCVNISRNGNDYGIRVIILYIKRLVLGAKLEKIVKDGVKVDFHIHSCFSKHKDGNKVKNNTIENSKILIQKLVENNVEMASITDHDFFSYELFHELSENESGIKFIPGVEFSIKLDKGRNVHVIALFNDSNDERLSLLNSYLIGEDGNPTYDSKSCYTESKFLEILRKIDLDVILIAHQKNSPMSTRAQKQDLTYSGTDIFNEYIGSQYFNAVELRNIRNDHFYKMYKEENNLTSLKWITGTDCHNWNTYPQSKDSEKDKIDFTYMKILKNFKGLVMAFTDESRISTKSTFFAENKDAISELKINHNGVQTNIPLSPGINVIIGDNSSGKSALLHLLTGENHVKPKTKYSNFKNKYALSVEEEFNDLDKYRFDQQGEIRERMEDEKFNILSHFKIENDSELNCNVYRDKLINKLNDVIEFYKKQNAVQSEINLKIEVINTERYSLYFEILEYNYINNSKTLVKIDELIVEVLSKLDEIIELTNDRKFNLIYNILDKYKNKNNKKIKQYSFEKSKQEIVNSILNEYNDIKVNFNNTLESNMNDYNNKKNDFIKSVVKYKKIDIEIKTANEKKNRPISEVELPTKVTAFSEYKLISKFSTNTLEINQNYFEKIFLRLFRKGSQYAIIKDSFTLMYKALNGKSNLIEANHEEIYQLIQKNFEEQLNDEFKIKSVILKNSDNSDEEYSMGMNAKIYFDILYSADNKNIYIIDQPEDDLSQKSLNESVLGDFKKIAQKKQIIMITHNPQFIVNLDVDNVIYVKKDNSKLYFYSGALEYENEEYSILKIVSENIDGGSESIEKRWKRYGN